MPGQAKRRQVSEPSTARAGSGPPREPSQREWRRPSLLALAALSLAMALLLAAIFVPGPWRWATRYVLELGPAYAPSTAAADARAELFQRLPDRPGQIVFLGDDLIHHGPWHELFPDARAVNRGIEGDLSFDVVQRLDEVLVSKPRAVFIMMGYNDVLREVHWNTTLSNHRRVLRRIAQTSPETRVYVHSVLPCVKHGIERPKWFAAAVDRVNQELQDWLASRDETFLDVRPELQDGERPVPFSAETYLAWRDRIAGQVALNRARAGGSEP